MDTSTPPNTDDFSLVGQEREVMDFWEKNHIFAQSLKKNEKGPVYIFYDGPPFATGLPHHGHLLASTIKDIAPRYFTMKGHYVQRRFGWDCHGLPIENEIDKKLGMSAWDAVKEKGLKAYNDQCRGIVQKYTREWRQTITRLGRWVDFDNDYKTMDASFMESVWWVVKELWKKGLLYEGTKVVPFSTQLQTPLSNFEAGLDYRPTQDPAITVLFPLEGEGEGEGEGEQAFVAAWTTTPWTLPSNLAICVNPSLDYVRVRDEQLQKDIYLAKAALPTYSKNRDLTVVSQCKGQDLKGKRYRPLFPYFEHLGKKEPGLFQILADDYVTSETGTGIVHNAPAFGEDDDRVLRQAGVATRVCPVDHKGCFTDEVTHFAGQYVKEADKKIINHLKEKDLLYHHSTIVHNYPFCYRSGTPLLYKAIPCWYVKVESIKEDLLACNAQINWVPSHIKNGRFGKWLENARDWAIGRDRVWGTPIPLWKNDQTGKIDCFGSVAEVEKATGVHLEDLHRENVDPLTYTREGEEGTYHRIPQVLDCWFESGSMPYAQEHYPFKNKENFAKGFPAEFVAEGLDQTRGWFYTLTVLSTALFKRPAFKNVIVNGLVLAEDGKKMSKSKGNFTAPDKLMETYGADALRLYLIHSSLVKAEEQCFSDNGLKEMTRRVLLPWYNAFKFFKTYSQVDNWKPSTHFEEGEDITDRWILSKLQTLTQKVSTEMEAYRLYQVLPPLFDFIDDLTNWYIRLNRRRFWANGLDRDKCQAFSTLYTTITQVSTLMAPFAPFMSEGIFQGLKKFDPTLPLSVHLCSYPEQDPSLVDEGLEDAVARMQQIILLGRQKRNQEKIKVKTPLQSLTIIHQDQDILHRLAALNVPIQSELNVKEIRYDTHEEKYIELFAQPNSPILGKKLGKKFGHYRKLITALHQDQCRKVEQGQNITLDGQVFSPEEIIILRKAKEGTNTLSNQLISIDLHCHLTDELTREGLAREVVNRIQKTRKDMNLKVSDHITVEFCASPSLCSAIEEHKAYICQETLCDSLEQMDDVNAEFIFDIDGNSLKAAITKVATHA